MLFRPLSVLASKLPSIFWGIDTGALYETWKQHQISLAPLGHRWSLPTPQAKAKLLS
jgi:hypothetical protein